MLPRKNRLPLRQEFLQVQKNGQRIDSVSFGLTFRVNPTRVGDAAQAAFIVTKKIDSRSVVRHRVKRKLVHALAPLLSSLPSNLDLIFFAKTVATTRQVSELKAEIELVLKKANLF